MKLIDQYSRSHNSINYKEEQSSTYCHILIAAAAVQPTLSF